MVRQRINERPKAAGKQIHQVELFPDVADLSNYRYSCFNAMRISPVRWIGSRPV